MAPAQSSDTMIQHLWNPCLTLKLLYPQVAFGNVGPPCPFSFFCWQVQGFWWDSWLLDHLAWAISVFYMLGWLESFVIFLPFKPQIFGCYSLWKKQWKPENMEKFYLIFRIIFSFLHWGILKILKIVHWHSQIFSRFRSANRAIFRAPTCDVGNWE